MILRKNAASSWCCFIINNGNDRQERSRKGAVGAPDGDDRAMLAMGSATGHTSDRLKAAAKAHFLLVVIPGGVTQFAQPVDCGYAARVRSAYQTTCFLPWLARKDIPRSAKKRAVAEYLKDPKPSFAVLQNS